MGGVGRITSGAERGPDNGVGHYTKRTEVEMIYLGTVSFYGPLRRLS